MHNLLNSAHLATCTPPGTTFKNDAGTLHVHVQGCIGMCGVEIKRCPASNPISGADQSVSTMLATASLRPRRQHHMPSSTGNAACCTSTSQASTQHEGGRQWESAKYSRGTARKRALGIWAQSSCRHATSAGAPMASQAQLQYHSGYVIQAAAGIGLLHQPTHRTLRVGDALHQRHRLLWVHMSRGRLVMG